MDDCVKRLSMKTKGCDDYKKPENDKSDGSEIHSKSLSEIDSGGTYEKYVPTIVKTGKLLRQNKRVKEEKTHLSGQTISSNKVFLRTEQKNDNLNQRHNDGEKSKGETMKKMESWNGNNYNHSSVSSSLIEKKAKDGSVVRFVSKYCSEENVNSLCKTFLGKRPLQTNEKNLMGVVTTRIMKEVKGNIKKNKDISNLSSLSCDDGEYKGHASEEKEDSLHCKPKKDNKRMTIIFNTPRVPEKKVSMFDKEKVHKIEGWNGQRTKNTAIGSLSSVSCEGEDTGCSSSDKVADSRHCTTKNDNKGKAMTVVTLDVPETKIYILDQVKGQKIRESERKRKKNKYNCSPSSPCYDEDNCRRSSSDKRSDSPPCKKKKLHKGKTTTVISPRKNDMKTSTPKPSDKKELASPQNKIKVPMNNSDGTVCMISQTQCPASNITYILSERTHKGRHVDKEHSSSSNGREAGVKRHVKGKRDESRLTKDSCHKYKKPFDDTLTESVVNNLAKDMKSVGVLISHGDVQGTVFCAGEKFVLTAYHVIKDISGNDLFNSNVTFVNFNESPFTQAKEIFVFKTLAFYNEILDVAVLEVSNPIHLPKGITLSKLNHDGISNVSVIGYGHPNHAKKALDPGCTLVSSHSSRIDLTKQWLDKNRSYHRGALKAIEKSPDVADIGLGDFHNFHFIIDNIMEHGVSGAPALRAGRDGRTKVTGIVTHGTPKLYFLLPELVKSPNYPCEHRFAIGTTMESIYELISTKDVKLANTLFYEG